MPPHLRYKKKCCKGLRDFFYGARDKAMSRLHHYGAPRRTKRDKMSALTTLLILRADLAAIDLLSVARSHGLAVPELAAMIAKEQARRDHL